MRKLGIVNDFKNVPLPGTFNMTEKTNFLCGKGMDIQDEIRVRSISIWNSNILTDDFQYDQFEGLKKDCIKTINIAKDQSQSEKDSLTKWVIEIDTKKLLREYLYNQIYTDNIFSEFHQLDNNNIANNNKSLACYNYIDANILSRYGIKEFILWVQYHDLRLNNVKYTKGIDTITFPLLKTTPFYTFFAKPKSEPDKNKAISSTKLYNDGLLEVNYKQIKSSLNFTFSYYYDIIFYKL